MIDRDAADELVRLLVTMIPVPLGKTQTHAARDCDGEPCPVHTPSTHALRDAPAFWRADRRIVERRCAHGVGHPDPDDRRVRLGLDDGVHGCDGCCRGNAS